MIDAALIQHIARLARMGLEPEECESLTSDLGKILAHFEELAQVDLEGAPEWTGALLEPGTPGADEPEPWADPRGTLLSLTEHSREGFVVVPAILDRPSPGTGASSPSAEAADADTPTAAMPEFDDDPADDEDAF